MRDSKETPEELEELRCKFRICTVCDTRKPLIDFHRGLATLDGRLSQCKTCKNKKNMEWRKRNPDKLAKTKKRYYIANRDRFKEYQKNYHKKYNVDNREFRRRWLIAKRYGLNIDQYTKLWESQGGCCGICKKLMLRPTVDHDHSNGKVRGLLCTGCNASLGKLGDNIQGLMVAIDYLKRAESLTFEEPDFNGIRQDRSEARSRLRDGSQEGNRL